MLKIHLIEFLQNSFTEAFVNNVGLGNIAFVLVWLGCFIWQDTIGNPGFQCIEAVFKISQSMTYQIERTPLPDTKMPTCVIHCWFDVNHAPDTQLHSLQLFVLSLHQHDSWNSIDSNNRLNLNYRKGDFIYRLYS